MLDSRRTADTNSSLRTRASSIAWVISFVAYTHPAMIRGDADPLDGHVAASLPEGCVNGLPIDRNHLTIAVGTTSNRQKCRVVSCEQLRSAELWQQDKKLNGQSMHRPAHLAWIRFPQNNRQRKRWTTWHAERSATTTR